MCFVSLSILISIPMCIPVSSSISCCNQLFSFEGSVASRNAIADGEDDSSLCHRSRMTKVEQVWPDEMDNNYRGHHADECREHEDDENTDGSSKRATRIDNMTLKLSVVFGSRFVAISTTLTSHLMAWAER